LAIDSPPWYRHPAVESAETFVILAGLGLDSRNWRGRLLTSHEIIVDLIGATTTRHGLKVHAERDVGSYPTSVTVSDADMTAIPVRPHDFPRRVELHDHRRIPLPLGSGA
jgi:hypothetical protein